MQDGNPSELVIQIEDDRPSDWAARVQLFSCPFNAFTISVPSG